MTSKKHFYKNQTTEISEEKFKRNIWNNVNYFKKIYIDENRFFTHKTKINKPSDIYYIDIENLKEWVRLISNKYDAWLNNKGKLIKDLLEYRRGQYSNGTLFSSSRLIAEMFYKDENRNKFLKWLGLDLKFKANDFKWILEYRLPIFGKKDKHPAQLDLVLENSKYFIGIESKMKEIYKKNYVNDFELRYCSKKINLLSEFTKDFKITRITRRNGKIAYRLSSKGDGNQNNFYYKQQICHLLGIRAKQLECPSKKYIFVNFVFDIGDVPGCINSNGANIRYEWNEKRIFNILKKYFDKTDIKYRGLLTHKKLLQTKLKL